MEFFGLFCLSTSLQENEQGVWMNRIPLPTPSHPHCCSQRIVSFVWRPKQMRKHSHLRGTLRSTPPGLAVSGKSELQKKMPYFSPFRSSTWRTTVLMTSCPSTILWAQMILRPSQSKWTDLFKPFKGTGSSSWHIGPAGKDNNFSFSPSGCCIPW